MLTYPCYVDPLTPHFYIVKFGLQGKHPFLSFALKHRLWVLVRIFDQHKDKKKSFLQPLKIAAYCIGMFA